jgi:hypothetical protein
MEVDNRPWIKVDAFTLTAPLTVDPAHNGMHTSVRVIVENIGHSLATNIRHTFKTIPFPYGEHKASFLQLEMMKVCAGIPPTDINRDVLFPGDKLSCYASISPNVSMLYDVKSHDVSASLLSLIIGCVVYQSPSSSNLHHTSFIYMLSPLTKFEGKDIPIKKLKLLPFFNSVDAN